MGEGDVREGYAMYKVFTPTSPVYGRALQLTRMVFGGKSVSFFKTLIWAASEYDSKITGNKTRH